MPSTPKTIAIFGATGQTGRALIAAAFAKSWLVRALVRPSSRPLPASPNLTVLSGDLDDHEAVRAVIDSSDAVCCVFGPRPPYTDIFCAEATRAIVEAMRDQGARRLICQTGAMVGRHVPNRSFWFERMARAFDRRQPDAAEDRRLQEAVVEASDLDWTILKPPRLTDGPLKGRIRAGPNLEIGLLSKLSLADLAAFTLQEIEESKFRRQAVFLLG